MIDSVEEYGISIHALRVEGDHQHSTRIRPRCNFYPRPPGGGRRRYTPSPFEVPLISIHALRVEGDSSKLRSTTSLSLFLSTPSGWRATALPATFFSCSSNFYPRPPGGGRLITYAIKCDIDKISIHALRVEGDKGSVLYTGCPFLFLSTPSGWRATGISNSIPSLLCNFYPRPPGGGRPVFV